MKHIREVADRLRQANVREATDQVIRDLYKLPPWVGIAPVFIDSVNAALVGVESSQSAPVDEAESDSDDTLSSLADAAEGLFKSLFGGDNKPPR